MPLADGFLIVALGAAFFATIEVEKQLRLRLFRSRAIYEAPGSPGTSSPCHPLR